ncbi:ATP-binding protein [Flavonifractor sp. An82]|uniref:ATP-binding protein n=1 Tax=Flavonifractor sp. An82 TaxID=1965660 RepID=UPI000B3875C8|nr:ATP-binding protein [Flavonifractor sp. An82]OUN19618.1 ATP-binding protein [Flavonifractor sp. An82]
MKEIALYILDIAQNSITANASVLEVALSETAEAIAFVIADNGKGMSPQLLAQVSDPFTTTRTTRKMGLGIPLLRMAVEQTGGSLTIESTEGVGTTVTARFCAGHIDCPPVGDMAGTITLLLQGAPQLELHYTRTADENSFQLTTEEIRAQLGPEISLAEPEIILWLREYLQEQEMLLREHKGMKA